MKIIILFLMGFVSCISFTDAITGWSTPTIATKDGSTSINLAEDKAAGFTIATLAVTGAGAGATLTYAIVDQPTTNKLVLTAAALKIDTGKSFDYETEKTYVFKVKVVDSTDSAATGTGTATLTLSISNVMDVAPVFAKKQYATTIPDGSTAETQLITVAATDVETSSGDTITYSITAGNTGTVFTIGASTGVITIASGKSVAASTLGGYTLTVTASDTASTPLTDTTTVWVAVTTCSSDSVALIASGITMIFAFCVSYL